MTSKQREDKTKVKNFDPSNHDEEGNGDATQKTTTTEEGNHHDDDDDDATRTTTTRRKQDWGRTQSLEPCHGRHKECGHDNTHIHKSHI